MIVKGKKQEHSEIAHNFKNRYISSEDLQKPSAEVNNKKIQNVREKLDEIVGIKKEASFGTNIKKLGTTTT